MKRMQIKNDDSGKGKRKVSSGGGAKVVIIIAALCGLLLGANYYIDSMRESLWTQSVADVLEITEQGAHAFEVYFRQGFAMLEGRANNFAQYESTNEKAIKAKLDLYVDGVPSFVVMDLTHGILYFNSSSQTTLSEEEAAAYLKLPDKGILEPFLGEYSGQRMLGYYERFTFADGAEGMVRKSYLLSDVAEEFSMSFFDDTGFSYVISGEGNIVLRSDNPNSNRTFSNVFDVITAEKNTDADVNAFRDGLSSGKRGAMRLIFNDEECVFTFTPIADTEGWYVISIIPSDSIMDRTEQLLKTGEMFLFMIGITLFVFLLFIVVIWQYRKNIRGKETELKYREELFGILASGSEEAFMMLSGGGLVTEYVSPNIEQLTGISRKAALSGGLSVLNASVQSRQQRVGDEELRSIPLGRSVVYEGKWFCAGTKEERWMEERIYHFSIDGREKFIIVFSDKTEDRKKEYALKEALDIAQTANQSKSAFLSNMSHDIRTPMNAIVGLSTLLQRDAENPDKVREHTRKITASSQHLLGLINDVLDMSKIESGKTTLNIGEINLAEIVEELGTIMRPQAKNKNQEFKVSVCNLTDEHVLGDKLRINQVLLNILSNAVKYTPEGGCIELAVRQIPYRVEGFAHFRFQVRDNGIGMDHAYLESIFEPFSRAEDSLSSGIQGTGLGMAITKNLVEMMGGSVTVKSRPGEGSVFTVDLELQIQKQQPDAGFWTDNGIYNALIVDDEIDVCTGVMAAMASTGVAVQFALDGGTAVQMVSHACREGNEYSFVLLDWKMPGMDGLETARRIREIIPQNVLIMILTSYDYSDIEEEGRAAGIDAFLPKPFFLGNLKRVLRGLKRKEEPEAADGEYAAVLRGRHFLAAEDNKLNAEILTELLSMVEADCEVEVNGKAVLERFEASIPGEFDAILMDIQMPVMNGYEACRAIRASNHPLAKTIPIIAMTANAFADDVAQALNSGMNAHIAKPVDMDKLEETMKKIFGNRE